MSECLVNLKKCKAICCKTFFVTIDNMNEDLARYFRLHNVDVFENTLRFNLPCKMLNLRTLRCNINETKPNICKEFPKDKSKCPTNCIFYKKQIE